MNKFKNCKKTLKYSLIKRQKQAKKITQKKNVRDGN